MREHMLWFFKEMKKELARSETGSIRHDVAVIFYLRTDEWLLRDNFKTGRYFYAHR